MMGDLASLAASRAATTVDDEVTLIAGRAKAFLRAYWKSYILVSSHADRKGPRNVTQTKLLNHTYLEDVVTVDDAGLQTQLLHKASHFVRFERE
jgi:hypothetical protein